VVGYAATARVVLDDTNAVGTVGTVAALVRRCPLRVRRRVDQFVRDPRALRHTVDVQAPTKPPYR
jgi:hypothetical protein